MRRVFVEIKKQMQQIKTSDLCGAIRTLYCLNTWHKHKCQIVQDVFHVIYIIWGLTWALATTLSLCHLQKTTINLLRYANTLFYRFSWLTYFKFLLKHDHRHKVTFTVTPQNALNSCSLVLEHITWFSLTNSLLFVLELVAVTFHYMCSAV